MATVTLVGKVTEIRQDNLNSTLPPVCVAVCEHHTMDEATGHIRVDKLEFPLPEGFIEQYEESILAYVAEHQELPIQVLQEMAWQYTTPSHEDVKKVSEQAPRPEGWGVFA